MLPLYNLGVDTDYYSWPFPITPTRFPSTSVRMPESRSSLYRRPTRFSTRVCGIQATGCAREADDDCAEETKELYDRHGMAAFEKGPGGMDQGQDLDDLLAQMFGMGGMGGMGGMPGMGGMGGPGGRPAKKQRGRDVVHQYEVTLEDLYKGKTVKLSSTRNKFCSVCEGYALSPWIRRAETDKTQRRRQGQGQDQEVLQLRRTRLEPGP